MTSSPRTNMNLQQVLRKTAGTARSGERRYMMRGLGWLNSTSLDVGQCTAINGDGAD